MPFLFLFRWTLSPAMSHAHADKGCVFSRYRRALSLVCAFCVVQMCEFLLMICYDLQALHSKRSVLMCAVPLLCRAPIVPGPRRKNFTPQCAYGSWVSVQAIRSHARKFRPGEFDAVLAAA